MVFLDSLWFFFLLPDLPNSFDLAIRGLAVKLDMVSRLSSSSRFVSGGLCMLLLWNLKFF